MKLNEWVATQKRALLEELVAGKEPSFGSFDSALLREGKVKGKPQMGTTRFEPNSVHLEFIFSDPTSTATVLTVTVTPPEKIVFLPVPEWVVESIWQGEIDGTFQFESDAKTLIDTFSSSLFSEQNLNWFRKRQPKRRE